MGKDLTAHCSLTLKSHGRDGGSKAVWGTLSRRGPHEEDDLGRKWGPGCGADATSLEFVGYDSELPVDVKGDDLGNTENIRKTTKLAHHPVRAENSTRSTSKEENTGMFHQGL